MSIRLKFALVVVAAAVLPLALAAGMQLEGVQPWLARLLAGAFTVAIGIVASQRPARRLQRLSHAADDLADGRFEVRADDAGADEIGRISRALDMVASGFSAARASLEDAVAERTAELQQLNDELSLRNVKLAEQREELAQHRYREAAKGRALAALTAEADLSDIISAAMGELAGPIRAAVMICYQLEGEDRRTLVPVASYAASEAARTTHLRVDGLAEQALHRGRVEILDQLPDGIDLRFDCLVAAGRPRSLSLIPLGVGKRRSGLIMVGGLSPFTHESLAPLTDLASPIALTMARHSLIDETERIARELSRRNAELAEKAAELEAQGEELKAHQAELELKNREVQKADRLKTEFLANMSHELRTPLNAVIGFSELLLEERGALSQMHVQYVDDIHASGRHLLTLINRVLDLAKIEAGSMTLQLEPLDPGEVLAQACMLLGPQAAKKKIELQLEQHATRKVLADAGKLQQVLLNLVANAVKFSPQGSVVRVGARDAGTHVRFYVIDQGPGIAEDLQPQLFKPFFQAENPMVKKHEGTGLGLAISRRLVEQHGGAIGCDSLTGHGCTFWFTLPPAPDDGVVVARGDDEAPVQFPAAHVLVADDHDLNRELVRTLLERRGCRVTLAKDGEEALRMVRSERPDVVLLDLAMPRMDGIAVAAELRGDGRTAAIPLVAFTAVPMAPGDERMQQFDAYVPKPVDRKALEATVARLVVA